MDTELELQRQALHHALMQHAVERVNSALLESTCPAAGWAAQKFGRADDVDRTVAAAVRSTQARSSVTVLPRATLSTPPPDKGFMRHMFQLAGEILGICILLVTMTLRALAQTQRYETRAGDL